MKPVQWILAVVVLVVIVFVVTFAMNFMGDTEKKDTSTGDHGNPVTGDSVLVFSEVRFPIVMPGYVAKERQEYSGYHDFEFSNPTNEEVTLSLNSTSCSQCVTVSFYQATEQWLTRRSMTGAGEVVGPALQPLLAPGFFTVLASEKGLRDEMENIKPIARYVGEVDTQAKYAIRPHAYGWIRLGWSDTKLGLQSYTAELLTKQKTAATVKLEAHVRFVEPVVFLNKDIGFQNPMTFTAEELQKGPKKVAFVFWSLTRGALHPKTAVVLPPNWKAEQMPIEVGEPQAVPPEQWPFLQMEKAKSSEMKLMDNFHCAYQFQVTIHDRSLDNKHPFPYGPFKVRIKVTFEEDNVDPIICTIRGSLEGDLHAAKGTDERIPLGKFAASSGSEAEVAVLSDVPGQELEIDRERTAAFLTTKLEKDKTDKTGRAWILKVQVEPNKIEGDFPRDEEFFTDTAVYVKTKGDSSRSLRIPVWGKALAN